VPFAANTLGTFSHSLSLNNKNFLFLCELFDRLLANLTQPAIICFQGELPEEKTNRNYYIETEEHLQLYKQVGSPIDVL